MMRFGYRLAVALAVLLPSKLLVAQVASSPSSSASAPSATNGGVYETCVEHVPEGARRPTLHEVFPEKGLAGYALPLEVIVDHGAGETVLPHGFSLQAQGVEAFALSKRGFALPSPDGVFAPKLESLSKDQ